MTFRYLVNASTVTATGWVTAGCTLIDMVDKGMYVRPVNHKL